MKQSYLLLVLIGLLGQRAWGQTTAWRPFRPGFVYNFAQVGSAASTALHTLRVDSAYATTSGDSVYTFNRLLRLASGSNYQYRKSRNNLLGARLRWQPGSRDYYLEANAELLVGAPIATALLLRPRAAVGSSWVASATPALTATLSSRTLGLVGGVTDSLVTITLSNGQLLVLSKQHGLVRGPQWLTLAASGTATPTNWQQLSAPQLGLGAYDPRNLFAMQPGTLLGYSLDRQAFLGGFSCAEGYRLRRILTRTQTADSLVLTYQEQERVTYYPVPAGGCTTLSGTFTKPVRTGRWAFSLRTGRSPQFVMLGLLTYEYRAANPAGSFERLWYTASHQLNTSTGDSQLSSLDVVPASGTGAAAGSYQPLLDAQNSFKLATGTGPLAGTEAEFTFQHVYTCPAGATCPLPPGYADLLPTRAALAAQVATLHPNPTAGTQQATLSLAAAAPAGTTLLLTDALGSRLWSHPLAAGQLVLPVPIAGRPTGLYLVQLAIPGQPLLTWKLTAN